MYEIHGFLVADMPVSQKNFLSLFQNKRLFAMEQDPHLLVYRASAGSGKTFTLAVEYIRQLIEDPFAYRRILAVTFTNKATTEMKERILSQLYGIAHKTRARTVISTKSESTLPSRISKSAKPLPRH